MSRSGLLDWYGWVVGWVADDFVLAAAAGVWDPMGRDRDGWIRMGKSGDWQGARVTAMSVQCVSRCRACLSGSAAPAPVRVDVAFYNKKN